MRCPTCGADSGVIDSRKINGNRTERRRRKCKACGQRFTTIEVPVEEMPYKLLKELTGVTEKYTWRKNS